MYLFFDTETTGLPLNWKAPVTNLQNWPRIVQLAYLLYDKKGNQVLSGNYIIKPDQFSIPSTSTRIHGITNEKAQKQGIQIKSVLVEMNSLISRSDFLIAHNISFDEKVLGAEFLRQKMSNPIEKIERICTMMKTINFCHVKGSVNLNFPKLTTLHYKLFGSHFNEQHNAFADVTATAKCFWELKTRKIL